MRTDRLRSKVEVLERGLPGLSDVRRRVCQLGKTSRRLAKWFRGLDDRDRANMDGARTPHHKPIATLGELGEHERARECTDLAIRHGVWRERLQMQEHFMRSCEREVWNEGSSSRVVLLFDIVHPSLSAAQRQALPPELLSMPGVVENFMTDRGPVEVERRPDGRIAMTPPEATGKVLDRYLDDLGLPQISRRSDGLHGTPEMEAPSDKSGTS
jgi:hypothetical protein